jgi:hypothetical protein
VGQLRNVPGQTFTAMVVTYALAGKSGAHQHAGSVIAYMLSGAIRSENSAIRPVKVYNRLLKNAMQQLNSGARKHSGSAMEAQPPRA